MSIVRKALIKASGNRFVQTALRKNVQVSQTLMGIGAGSGVDSSGERVVFDVLRRKFRAPYCIFDVGSNTGQFLQLAAMSTRNTGSTIHCFEPARETFRMLSDSARTIEGVKLNNCGLGRVPGEAVLHYDASGSGLASLTKRKLDHFGIDFSASEAVTIDTIDRYCATNAVDHIHLLKLDIEGHELDALAGARTMFAKNGIDLVTFEFGGCNIDTRSFLQDYWYFFIDMKMSLSRITPSGYLSPIRAYSELDEQFRTTNFLAAK